MKKDTISRDIPLDRNWNVVDEINYIYYFPNNIVKAIDNTLIESFPYDIITLLSNTPDCNLGFVFSFAPDGEVIGLAIKRPDLPEYSLISNRLWKRVLHRLMRFDSIALSQVSRFAFQYPSSWFRDLKRHLDSGLPIDHIDDKIVGPDIVPTIEQLRKKWLIGRNDLIISEIQNHITISTGNSLPNLTETLPILDPGIIKALQRKVSVFIDKSLSFEDKYLYYKNPYPAVLIIIFDGKSRNVNQVAIEANPITAYYYLNPVSFSHLIDMIEKRMALPRGIAYDSSNHFIYITLPTSRGE